MLWVAANDQKIACPREPYVQALFGPVAPGLLVGCRHDDTAFESFETEDMAVEDLFVVPEGIPIGRLAIGLAIGLLRVPSAGCQHGDVGGFSALFEEFVDDVVRPFERLFVAAGLQPHGRPISRAGLHTYGRHRRERFGDLPRVAQSQSVYQDAC